MGHLQPLIQRCNLTKHCYHHRNRKHLHCSSPLGSPARQKVVISVAASRSSTSSVAICPSATRITLPVTSLYTSQAYTHRRALGPVQLEVVPGKGLGWRATRDIATGELLFVSLPVAALYGAPGQPPGNEELTEALRQSWTHLVPLERRWLLLLADCCTASCAPAVAAAAATTIATAAGTAASGQSVVAAAVEMSGVAVAPEAASSPPPQPPPVDVLEGLLLRARALLAEVQEAELDQVQQQQQQQQQLQLEQQQQPTVAEAGDANGTPRPSVTPCALTAYAITDANSLAATSGAQILPPVLFGTSTGLGTSNIGGSSITSSSSSTITSSSSSSSSGGGGVLADLVQRYSYSEGGDDLVLTELQDVSPVSCAGLWPEAALLNHSCCPNASLLVIGGAAYLRAGRPVLEGEELTVSYLGLGVFKDVAERRSRLRASHGFQCTCPRCLMEHEHFPTCRYPYQEQRPGQHHHQLYLQRQTQAERWKDRQESSGNGGRDGVSSSSSSSSSAVLDDELLAAALMGRRGGGPLQALLNAVFGSGRFLTSVAADHALLRRINRELVSDLEAAAHAALTAPSRPRQRQAALLGRLEGLLEQVETSCAFLELPPRGRLMSLASVYGLVRLTSELAELSQQATPERRLQLLQLATEIVEDVAPGSDGHVTAAVKAAGVARRVYGADSPTARKAELTASRAHLARYGRELLSDPGLLRRLASIRRRLMTGSGLAASMGVLAWMQQVGSE
ncbi:hypothetical protein VaNZ11_003608 [Volvox africanus]|uniref:SET domain-containing protein n=1 Tax=Volvox africanus TaxID=51714 RepID=A0ABQ5RUV6_9CHLO|nr:hypothetical protein VaNZ11_003608 [Volvox africanus]